MTVTVAPERALSREFAIYPAATETVARLCEELSISPVLSQILINRGLGDAERAEAFLLGGQEMLFDPELLDGIPKAADIVAEAVRGGQRLLIHGDYDADGVSGTALLVAFLREVGADAQPYIPHRIDEGYGLSPDGARHAAAEGFHVMVSVDCGSSSPEVVELARSLGLRVVVTDHHMVTEAPSADAFVNPRAPGCTYPFPHLSGAGVAFKLVQAVSRRLGCGEPEAYLDLVAIGTIGDVVPLIGENRVLVREGLAVMERLDRPGVAALARVAGLGARAGEGEQPLPGPPLGARDVAFEIAPRINACGRLEHALQAALLLLETDDQRADALAREIDALNQQRRDMEADVRQSADAMVVARGLQGTNAIVEADERWHQGIVGITANRLLDKYGLPAFIISLSSDGSAKGSARAPAHVDLYECLKRCADLFTHFGGHPRAGGFSMPAENVHALRLRLQEVVPQVAGPREPALRVDVELPLSCVDFTLLEELEALAPFGQANPPPLFLARGVRVRYPEVVKQRHWRFQAAQAGASARCIAFNLVERLPQMRDGELFDMLYEVELERYRGEMRANFKVRELVPQGGVQRPTPAVRKEPPSGEPAEAPPRQNADASDAETGRLAGVAVSLPTFAPDRCIPPSDPPPTDRWEVVDARREGNRGRYLADVVEQGRATIVSCRRDQVDFVKRVAAADAPAPATLRVVAYGAPIEITAGAEWILFTPPPFVEALAPFTKTSGGRCHVLFGGAELASERALIAAVAMSRDRLQLVYRLFKAGASPQGIFSEGALAAMLENSRQHDLRVESLKVALRIFCEMGVLEESARVKGRYRFTGQRAELERSSTYRRYSSLGESFARIDELFGREDARLGERLIPASGPVGC